MQHRINQKTLRIQNRDTQVVVMGQGEPVLFIHGAGIIGGWEFASVWAQKFQVICPYQMGWGGTTSPPLDAGLDDFVSHNLALMDYLGHERFHLIGFSMGGWIASTLAAQNNERIRKLVLVAPAGYWAEEHRPADLFSIDPAQVLDYLAADPSMLLRHLPPPEDPIAAKVEQYRNDSAFSLLAWDRLGSTEYLKTLQTIRAKCLLVWGKKDRMVPFSQAELWVTSIPGAVLHGIADVGHYPFLERPDSVNVVHEFLVAPE